MRIYGQQIGNKFRSDGTAAPYPGNTVISDLVPENPAYAVMKALRARLNGDGLDTLFILLPEDSYHMTVIQGINDLRREAGYWPPALPLDAPMNWADDYMEARVRRVMPPADIRMRFSCVAIDGADFRVRVSPADEGVEKRLRAYRDAVAREMGFYLPGHDAYRFHMTLAYVRYLPEGDEAVRLNAYTEAMNGYLQSMNEFTMGQPYPAFYRDMLSFSHTRLARDRREPV